MADMQTNCRFELSDGEAVAISAAVIRLAVDDYLRLSQYRYPRLVGGYHKLNWRIRSRMMGEILTFLRSPWGDTLSLGQSETILRRLETYASH